MIKREKTLEEKAVEDKGKRETGTLIRHLKGQKEMRRRRFRLNNEQIHSKLFSAKFYQSPQSMLLNYYTIIRSVYIQLYSGLLKKTK